MTGEFNFEPILFQVFLQKNRHFQINSQNNKKSYLQPYLILEVAQLEGRGFLGMVIWDILDTFRLNLSSSNFFLFWPFLCLNRSYYQHISSFYFFPTHDISKIIKYHIIYCSQRRYCPRGFRRERNGRENGCMSEMQRAKYSVSRNLFRIPAGRHRICSVRISVDFISAFYLGKFLRKLLT